MSKVKKLLALVLALAMVLSVSAFAGYDYADADKIDEACVESVSLMYGLDIMKGDGKNFNPNATITRAEMAKMIYVVLNYGKDDKAVNYTGAKLFSDVPAGEWYEGYVNYCAVTNLVQGDGTGKFNPTGTLTTAAAAKMLLTAIGYDAQARGYVGAGWDKQVLSDAAILGLLNGYNYPTNTAAPRQWVAVMFKNALLNALTYDTITPVIFNGLLTGNTLPTANYKTMGEKYFNLAEFEGVITANEYANLYGAKHLSAGKSNIGDISGLKVSTDLTEIGESRRGYYNTENKTVYFIADTGDNTEYSTGDAKDITTDTKFKNVTGIKKSSGIEYFENFDSVYADEYICEYRLAYGDPDALSVIPKNTTFSAAELEEIEKIFNSDDDDYDGHVVYVGTQRDEDASDKMSYKQFVKAYIEESSVQKTAITGNENGNWLRVVDNDGDGYADFVFHTVFTMAEVDSIAKNGTLTLTGDVYSGKYYVSSTELEEGDIVLHTYIDDEDYIELAPTFTGKVDKYTYRTDVLTVAGEDYVESDINEFTGYFNELEDAKKNREYTYYQDFFGHIRVYNLPNAADDELVLLTDAYFETDRSGDIYAVYAYLNGEVSDYDVYAPYTDVDMFIKNQYNNSNAWDRLIAKEGTTSLARYSEDEGELSLYDAKTYKYGKKNEKTGIKTDYINLYNEDVEAGQTAYRANYYRDAADVDAGFKADEGREILVQANKNTVFYYVTRTSSGKAVVNTVVGYKNSIDVVDSIVGIEAMYAVATNTWSDSIGDYYWVADVIVVETDSPVFNLGDDVVFAYDVVNKTYNDYAALDVVDNTAALDTLNVVNYEGDSYNDFEERYIAVPEFYFNTEDAEGDSYIIHIGNNYGKYGIYAGTVDRANKLYEYVVAVGGEQLDYDPETVKVFDLYGTDRITDEDDYEDALELETGCDYIFYAPKGEIVYAILVDATYTEDDGDVIVDNGRKLFKDIVADATKVPAKTAYQLAVEAAVAATEADPAVKADLEAAQAALAALTDLTAEQASYVADLQAAIAAELETIAKAEAENDARLAKVETLKTKVKEAIAEANESAELTLPADVLADTTEIEESWSTAEKDYSSVKAAVETWSAEIMAGNDAVLTANVIDQLADKYIAAKKAIADAEADQKAANDRANAISAAPISITVAGTTETEIVDTMEQALKDTVDDQDAEFEITYGDWENFEAGMKTIKVSVVAKYFEAKSAAVEVTFNVSVGGAE